jgi:superfamily II DNA or RNA helicase
MAASVDSECIELRPEQRAHCVEIERILQYSRVYVDTSIVGAGKTYASLYTAIREKRDLIVVAPLNVVLKWEQLMHKYGVKGHVLTYESLRNHKCELSQQWLRLKHTPGLKIDFVANKVPAGVMLVVDEFHYAVHESARTRAVFALARGVIKGGGIAAWLSATPFTKPAELRLFTRMLKNKVYDYTLAAHRLRARALCAAVNEGGVGSLCADLGFVTSCMLELSDAELFSGICSSIRVPHHSLKALDIQDCVCEVEEDEEDEESDESDDEKPPEPSVYSILCSIQMACVRISRRLEHLPPDLAALIMMKITNKHMRALELIKTECFVHNIKETEITHKNVAFVNYTDSARQLMRDLAHLNPVFIGGSTSGKRREQMITKFNTDDSVRLIVCNTRAICCGIDLDDKQGDRPRAVYISPGFDYVSMLQAIGRVYRIDSKSKPLVRFLYMTGFAMRNERMCSLSECRLINNIRRKSKFITNLNPALVCLECAPSPAKPKKAARKAKNKE